LKIYIFGAGASKGSHGEVVTPCAPLMNEIFHERYYHFGSHVGFLPHELKSFKDEIGDGSVEEWLTARWLHVHQLKTSSSKRAAQKLFGRIIYYLWWMLQSLSVHAGKDIYGQFVRKVVAKDEEFRFINFNYDTLLDRAYQVFGGAVLSTSLDNYLKYGYIKPHGSVNWFIPRQANDAMPQGIVSNDDYGARYQIASSQIFADGKQLTLPGARILAPDAKALDSISLIGDEMFGHDYLYPLMFLPLTEKMFEHVIGFSEVMIEQAKEYMKQASEIYLIGYRGQDKLFVDLLNKVQDGVKLHVIGIHDAKEIAERVQQLRGRLVVEYDVRGFEGFVTAL
jgi:hypothetical protein